MSIGHPSFARIVRTPSSERFLVSLKGRDVACLDVHFQGSGVAGTLVVFDPELAENDIGSLIESFDELFLPDVSLDEGNLVFTVVRGTVSGTFQKTPNNE